MTSSSGLGCPIVAVPARNEERRLPALLEALDRQSWCRSHGPLRVVVVLNNSDDASKDALLGSAASLPHLRIELVEVHFPERLAHVGSARRLAMDCALTALADPAHGVILTTDADAIPEPNWVDANLRAIAAGADLVGGKLYGNRAEEARFGEGFASRAAAMEMFLQLRDWLAHLVDPLDHDPWPRHCDHTGGSLAIRADLFRDLGGLPALPFREDLALVARARAASAKLVHPLDVRVEVSARLAGRAPGGMADCLKGWLRAEAAGEPQLVEDPHLALARFSMRRAIRRLDGMTNGERAKAGRALGIDAPSLLDARGVPFRAARLIECFAADEPDAPATVPISLAIAGLQALIAEREGASHAA